MLPVRLVRLLLALAVAFASLPLSVMLPPAAVLTPDTAEASSPPDGTLDPTFGSGGIVRTRTGSSYSGLSSIAVQSDGKIIVGGLANTLTLVRYLPDGSLDPSFGSNGITISPFTGHIYPIRLQPDGKILAGGWVSYDGIHCCLVRLARFLPDGTIDTAFGNGGLAETPRGLLGYVSNMSGLALQPDGKILISGQTMFDDPESHILVARYQANGVLDPTFGNGGRKLFMSGSSALGVTVMAVQPDGRILVEALTHSGTALLRLNQDGELDATFGIGGKESTGRTTYFRDINVQPDGKIVGLGGINELCLMRYNPDGTIDTSFGIGGRAAATANADWEYLTGLALQADGKIVVVGQSHSPWHMVVSRYDANGQADISFGTGGTTTPVEGSDVISVAIQNDGRISVAGASQSGDLVVVRLLASTPGALDPTFGSGGVVTTTFEGNYRGGSSVAVQPDGKIVVGGFVEGPSPAPDRLSLVRYDPDGTLDSSFGSGGKVLSSFNGRFYRIMLQSDGKIIALGWGSNDSVDCCILRLARYHSNGTLDTTFGNEGLAETPRELLGYVDQVYGLALQPDGKILIGGEAFFDGLTSYVLVARYQADGILDSTFGNSGRKLFTWGNRPYGVMDMAMQPDGRILVAAQLHPEFALLRLNPDGELDASFGSGGKVTALDDGSYFTDIGLQPDGKIVALGGRSNFLLRRYQANGTLDSSFGTNGQAAATANANWGYPISLALQADGRIVAAGVSSLPSRFVISRHDANGQADTTFGTGGTTALIENGTGISAGIQPDGRIIVAGTGPNSTNRALVVVRLLASTPGALQFSTSAYSVNENGGTATITVTRAGGVAGAVSVTAATTAGGTATPGADYTATTTTLSWASGDSTPRTFTIPITSDTLLEPNETVHLALSDPTGGATLGVLTAATLTITDDDSVTGLYGTAVQADAPAGYWRLREAAGTIAADSSSRGNNGAFKNGVALGQTGALPLEPLNTAITLDGVNDFVTVADAPALSPTAAVSVEAWVNLAAYSGSYPRLLSKPSAYELTMYTVPGAEGRLEWKVSLVSGDVLVNTAFPDRLLLGQWYHVVATYDGASLRIFINGKQKASKPASGAIKDSTNAFTISRPDRAIAASLDEAAVYGAALSPARVQAHYETVAPPPPASPYTTAVMDDAPAAYWRLNEDSGPQAADFSGNGNTGTYTNGVTQGVAGALTSESDAAAQFDGVNDFVRVPDAPGLSPTAAVSVEAWVNLTAYSGSYPRLLSKPGSYELTMYTVPGAEGRLEWKVSLASGDVLVNTLYADRLLLGQWYHVVATYDGADLRIFINGVQKAVKAVAGTMKDGTSPFTISRADRPIAAQLDEVAVYGAALPLARIQAHYAAR